MSRDAASTSSDLSKYTKDMITAVLISTPKKSTMRMLSMDYREIVGSDIPYKSLGYQTLTDYLKSIPDTVRVVGHGSGAEIQPIIKPNSSHINDLVQKQRIPTRIRIEKRKSAPIFPPQYGISMNHHTPRAPRKSLNIQPKRKEIPPMVEENLRKLIREFPNGISASSLQIEYEKRFNQLNPNDYGFANVSDMCLSLSGAFDCVLTPIRNLTVDENREIEDVEIDWELPDVPKDVHLFGEIPACLPDISENSFDFKISEVYHPGKFFGFTNNKKFVEFQKKLQDNLEINGNILKFPKLYLDKGLYCIANSIRFNRARILDVSNNTVKVNLIDYGSVIDLDVNNIYYLPKMFAELPAQALRCKIFGVSGQEWSVEFKEKFRGTIGGKLAKARVMKVDASNKILEIELRIQSYQVVDDEWLRSC